MPHSVGDWIMFCVWVPILAAWAWGTATGVNESGVRKMRPRRPRDWTDDAGDE